MGKHILGMDGLIHPLKTAMILHNVRQMTKLSLCSRFHATKAAAMGGIVEFTHGGGRR